MVLALIITFSACRSRSENHGGAVPDTYPVFPGCETYESGMMIRMCFADSLTGTMKNLIGAAPEKRYFKELVNADTVYFDLYIHRSGKIELDSVHPVAEEKYDSIHNIAARWVDLLPVVKPAKKSGSPVSVSFTIPVVFEGE
jgi:hypothetical protein